jgi:hypothetical protein
MRLHSMLLLALSCGSSTFVYAQSYNPMVATPGAPLYFPIINQMAKSLPIQPRTKPKENTQAVPSLDKNIASIGVGSNSLPENSDKVNSSLTLEKSAVLTSPQIMYPISKDSASGGDTSSTGVSFGRLFQQQGR